MQKKLLATLGRQAKNRNLPECGNEISGDDAKILIQNGCIAVAEGANMPTMQNGVDVYHEAKVR